RFPDHEVPSAVGVRPEDKEIAEAIGLDVTADAQHCGFSATELDSGLPGAAGSRRSSCEEHGNTIVPSRINLILEGRGRTVIYPDDLTVSAILGARKGRLECPRRAVIGRL